MYLAKYCASGNDFVLFHTFSKRDRSALARILCDRQNGVGADGLIVLVPHETHDFEWQFYNADGSEAEMCGNGSRACAHYAYTHDLADANMAFVTLAGVIRAQVEGEMVQSDLTPPRIVEQGLYVKGKRWWLINTGVPHLVTFDADMDHFDIEEARELRYMYNANVNIARVDSEGSLHVRTYERGVENETLACGTGMAACYYRALQEGWIKGSAKVYPRSGETLYMGMNSETITFKGAVKATFTTTWSGPYM